MSDKIEFWDIYDSDKKPTGRTMKRNDWHLKDGEYHLTVLGVMQRTDGRFLITKRVMTKAWAPGHWEVSGGFRLAAHTKVVLHQQRACILCAHAHQRRHFGGGRHLRAADINDHRAARCNLTACRRVGADNGT